MANTIKTHKPRYYLQKSGEFVIENYNYGKPFASFFPGIAGKYGIPIWVFYSNRGQGISSFGIKDKEHPILEYFPANKSWQFTPSHGFRTFIKVTSGSKTVFYEPFHNGTCNLTFELSNRMLITSAELTIEEVNKTLGLKTTVTYFTIPNDSFGGLVRNVTIQNISRSSKKLQVVDGLPQIVPFGTNNWCLKEMSRTIEAWNKVDNMENNVPFYRLAVDPADRPEVVHITEGNFYLGFQSVGNTNKLIKPIIDPQTVFGQNTDFSCPLAFLKSKVFKQPSHEAFASKTPAALLLLHINLAAGESKTFHAVAGYMRNIKLLNTSVKKIVATEYLDTKRQENRACIENLQNDLTTKSSSLAFDLYAKQTYLDNIMRGGYPLTFRPGATFYLYSRKHGDLERDYNKFSIQPAYFSQGNGNYRDVNQNRRCDTWFHPDINDENVLFFFNLLQLDGYNPLIVKGTSFILKDAQKFEAALTPALCSGSLDTLLAYLEKPFTPGDVIIWIEDNALKFSISNDAFLNTLMQFSEKIQEAEHGEGFWSDHWTYNLDILENYLAVFPEQEQNILFVKKAFTYFDNAECVKPRFEKFTLHNGTVKQLHSVYADSAKKESLKKRSESANLVRTSLGNGPVYTTNLINKLLCLFTNKLASLDPAGVGIEMEADKPNWYDSLNGLPGLFGSSVNETFELKRLGLFIKDALSKAPSGSISITAEVLEFLLHIDSAINEYVTSVDPNKDYLIWDTVYSYKDSYRQKIKPGVSGAESEIATAKLVTILETALRKIDHGIAKAFNKKAGVYNGYFIHEVTEYKDLTDSYVYPTKFVQKPLPLFLEANVHAMKVSDSKKQAQELYTALKNSPLYDKTLKMYKVTESLKSCPEEIGRSRVFPSGWLENESIWLHMEYKYLLELLKKELFEEFYAELKNTLIPFQNPARYGRSILENSSFIVSSAFPNKELHGNGFVARLSGSTAEFIQIWLIMNAGLRPFSLNNKNELEVTFKPSLAGWLFDKKTKSYSFTFLGKTMITYINPSLKNTFGMRAAQIKTISFDDASGKQIRLQNPLIPAPYAEQIRQGLIKEITIELL